MQLGNLISRHAQYRSDHTAVLFEDERLTYSEFNIRVNRQANALIQLGIRKDDAVAVILPNSLELLTLYWATAKIGAVVVPISPLLRGDALLTLLNDSGAKLVLTNQLFVPMLLAVRKKLKYIPDRNFLLVDSRDVPNFSYYLDTKQGINDQEPPAIDISSQDRFNLIYSSGTTGIPKGIVHSHGTRANYATLFASAFRMQPESVVLHSGSIVFNGAFLTLMPAMYLGATYILQKHFTPEKLVRAIKKQGVTHLMLVPSQIIELLNMKKLDPSDLESVEMILSLGAPLHRAHKEKLHALLPNKLYELYGLTEGFVTVLDRDEFSSKMDSVGAPLPFSEIKIVNERGQTLPPGEIGEIVGKSPILMSGYHNQPELTQKTIVDGWLHSGDLGYLDRDGYLYLVDRMKDLIISGAVNVYPRDIEAVITNHPLVKDAAVIGVPDKKWGETPVAFVVLNEQAGVSAIQIREWVNRRVQAKYQRISEVVFIDEFPKNVAGKVLKTELSKKYAQSIENAERGMQNVG